MPSRLLFSEGAETPGAHEFDYDEEEDFSDQKTEPDRRRDALDCEDEVQDEEAIIRGTRPWINHVLSTVDFDAFQDVEHFQDYINSCPFKNTNNVLEPIIKILATHDYATILRFVGLQPLVETKQVHRCVDLYRDAFRYRDNVAGRKVDRMKTNSCYLPRQCDFLYFVKNRPDLQTSFVDLAKMMGRPIKEIENLVPRFDGKLLLVTEVAAIAFLNEKDSEKHQKYEQTGTYSILSSQPSGILSIRDIVEQHGVLSKEEGNGRKKKKITKSTSFVGMSDFKSYKNSLSELQLFQHKIIGVDSISVKLFDDQNFKKYSSMKSKKIQSHGLMDTVGNSQNTLSSNPTTTQIGELIDSWMKMGVRTDTRRCYLGLTNCAVLTNMIRCGFSRADNCHRLRYCDLEMRSLEQLCTRRKGALNFDIFLHRQNESKCNKNNKSNYGCKIAHQDVFKCSLTFEGLLLGYRHDVLHAPINKFETIINEPRSSTIHRTWNDDYFYCQTQNKEDKDKRIYRLHGKKYDNVDVHLKNAYSLEQLSTSWRQSMAAIGVYCYHTLHIGRLFGAISSNMEGVDYIELSRVGHWSATNDTLALSYASIPNIDTICSIAGADSIESYLPIRCLLVPPMELQQLVFNDYHKALEEVEKVIEKAKQMEDSRLQAIAWDEQSYFTCSYIVKLSQYLLQSIPFIRQHYKGHDYFLKHRMFQEKIYLQWEKMMLAFYALMTNLMERAPLLAIQLKDYHFTCNSKRNKISLEMHCSKETTEKNSAKEVFSSICGFLQFVANEEIEGIIKEDRFAALLTEAVNTMMYNDLKFELNSIKDILKNVVSLLASSSGSYTRHSSIQTTYKDLMDASSSESSLVGKRSSKKSFEITSLPTFSMIDMEPEPIRKVYSLWIEPFKGQRALREVIHLPKEGLTRFDPKSRSTSTIAQRIRTICLVLELISKNSETSISLLQKYCNEHNLTLRQLYNKIQREISSNQLSRKGKLLSTDYITQNPKYKSAAVFWKELR